MTSKFNVKKSIYLKLLDENDLRIFYAVMNMWNIGFWCGILLSYCK
jgi:hypothetical protein